jgi:hypothetical protein
LVEECRIESDKFFKLDTFDAEAVEEEGEDSRIGFN